MNKRCLNCWITRMDSVNMALYAVPGPDDILGKEYDKYECQVCGWVSIFQKGAIERDE